ncbi:MAG: ATP-dependent Clp protease adaptor ClpS [Dehalococcoidia bacterium]
MIDAPRAVAPEAAPVQRTRGLEETLPPYRVLLHNDDEHDMGYVVRALVASVPELSVERAAEIMLEAHLHERAEVIVCPLERAELYRDRIQTYGLGSSIERV